MKYYKILNEEECHNGLQYKTGLNVDPLPFNPSGDCKPGGIYFAREDILAFLNHGSWIREVIIPEDAQVYENPGEPKKWKADKVILRERERIDVDVIKRLIKEGADPRVCDNEALIWAAENGHTEVVRLLIPVSDPKACDNEAPRWATEYEHTEVVKAMVVITLWAISLLIIILL